MTGYVSGNDVCQELSMDARGRVRGMHAFIPASGETASTNGSRWPLVASWLAHRSPQREQSLYGQENHYDAAGRLVEIQRQKSAAPTVGVASRHDEHYGYDRLDRLTAVTVDGKATKQFSYDKAGNRTVETDDTGARHNLYGAGTNRLVAITHGSGSGEHVPAAPRLLRAGVPGSIARRPEAFDAAWLYYPTSVPLAHLVFGSISTPIAHVNAARRTQRVVHNLARFPVAIYDESGRPIARYVYNSSGERIAKTIYFAPTSTTIAHLKTEAAVSQPGTPRYSLYGDQRLASEADDQGRLTTHYIYLYGKPVAKFEFALDAQTMHRQWVQIRQYAARLLGDTANNPATDATVCAVHTDHLGTPQAVTDASQHVVWQADTSAFGIRRNAHRLCQASYAKPAGIRTEPAFAGSGV